MREQARVTARQTTWTVALTVLAAVYLPMTLVTGIFGMNITEISSEATAPNAWWAVGAWVVVVTLTVAGILSYVAISKLRARNRKSDLEANDEAEKSNSKGKPDVGKWFGETSKDWIRWLKQKAKMVWPLNKSDGLQPFVGSFRCLHSMSTDVQRESGLPIVPIFLVCLSSFLTLRAKIQG